MVLSIIVFIYGLLLGSFINVVIIRLPSEESFFISRSKCMSCGNQLKFYDLVPVFSYLSTGGKCRYCKQKISPMYATVELYTALSALFCFHFCPSYIDAALYFSFFCMLTIVALIDLKHGIMFDSVFVFFGAVALALMFFPHSLTVKDHIIGFFVGGGLYLAVYLLARLYYGKEAFGQGDVIFLAVIGLYLGYMPALIIGFSAFYVAAIFAIIKLVRRKLSKEKPEEEFNLHSEMYFGPSMMIAAVLFCYVNLIFKFI